MARLAAGCSGARPDPAEAGHEAARGRAELDLVDAARLGVVARERVEGAARDPHGPVVPDGYCARALPDLDGVRGSSRWRDGCATAVRSIRRRTTRRRGRRRSRWYGDESTSSCPAVGSELESRARIELSHAVGASEPDRVAVDCDRRRGPDAVPEQLRLARHRMDPRELALPSLESPDGAVADCELDRIEREREQTSLSLPRGIRRRSSPRSGPTSSTLRKRPSFMAIQTEPSPTASPIGIPSAWDRLRRRDGRVRLGSILRVFPIGSTTQTEPSPAAMRGELNPTGTSPLPGVQRDRRPPRIRG